MAAQTRPVPFSIFPFFHSSILLMSDTILIVDDEPDVVDLLVFNLQ